ncbi:MAG: ERF family protein [Candidatus Riflebacteria bacterium]|nr:ERF family protein [Candidatus Riflebacteria bacterium]
MDTSTEIGALASALSKTQGMMKAAQLDGRNPFFNSRYSTLASVIEASRQALAANELAIVQGVSTEGDPLVVKISTMLIHSSNQWIRETITVKPAKVGIHELASAITYARRIALGSLLAIYADDDDGNLAAELPPAAANVTFIKETRDQKNTSPREARPKAVVSQKPPCADENQQPNDSGSQVVRTPNHIGQRAAKIREIFTLSGRLSQSPEEMKEQIGAIIGLGTGISDSSQIKDDQLDLIISTFREALAVKQNTSLKEAA